MIGTLQRHLINLDMLLADLEMLDADEYGQAAHAKLLKDIQKVLKSIEDVAAGETVASFQKAVSTTGLAKAMEDKRMPGIYNRLIGYVLQYWETSYKIDAILADQFDENADKRLDLLQVKHIKAKSQFKTVARAMGKADYESFVQNMGLNHPDWAWQA